MKNSLMPGEYLGNVNGWSVYRVSGGTLEGYKTKVPAKDKGVKFIDESTGRILNGIDVDRVVTTATTLSEFKEQVTKKKAKPVRYDPHKDEKQLKLV